jgi:hypothetical protein
MLTAATLGMVGYGLCAVGMGVAGLAGFYDLELPAHLASILFGLLLILAAAFVRMLVPGGLAFAIAALLGLQALALHAAVHVHGDPLVVRQIAIGSFAACLVVLARVGARRQADALLARIREQ